jgi:hypothetical protein
MDRITTKTLRTAVGWMAQDMGIADGPVWSKAANGENRARVGALILNPGSPFNGISWGVAQIMNPQGGERTLLRARTARDLYNAINIWRQGFNYARTGDSRNA